MVEADQRQLDLLMAAIAALLARPRPEGRAHMVDIALEDGEQPAPAGRQEIGDAAFEQMAEIVELVIVAQVGPAVLRLALQVPAIEIAVRRLRLFEVVDDLLDLRLDVGVAPVRQRVGCRLDPFADVGIPEHLDGEIMVVAREAQGRRRVGQRQRFQDAVLAELDMLAGDGARQAPSPAARARTGPRDGRRRSAPVANWLMPDPLTFLSVSLSPRTIRRTTSEQGRRWTPLTRLPAIMSISRSPASRPSAFRFMSMLVSGGRAASVMTSQLSKPTIATSDGTADPTFAQRVGRAARDLVVAAEQRVGLVAPGLSNRRATASRPQASDQTPER